MTAQQRLVELLRDPSAASATGPWLDLVDGRPGARGRLQDLWQSSGGAGVYDRALAVGGRLHPWLPDLLGGGMWRDFYRVEDRLGLRGGETVLDLACGPGTLTRRVAGSVGRDGLVVAVDLSEPMLARARRAVRLPNTAFARADAMDLPLRDGTVDAVVCSLCLHLVPDLDTALDEIVRVLRPGGRMALAVPAHGSGPARLLTEQLERGWQARLFAPDELVTALSRRGCVAVEERRDTVMQIVDAAAPG